SGRSFNIAYGAQISILDLANQIIALTGSDSEIAFKPRRKGDIRHSLADISYAGEFLGYSPRFDLEKGLLQTIQWYQQV
ncbi:MAG: hypothetical protein R3231_12010, partial [bacterium]|nr:hypothetical protein [bacterium]